MKEEETSVYCKYKLVEALVNPSTTTHEWDSDDAEKVLAIPCYPAVSDGANNANNAPTDPGEEVNFYRVTAHNFRF